MSYTHIVDEQEVVCDMCQMSFLPPMEKLDDGEFWPMEVVVGLGGPHGLRGAHHGSVEYAASFVTVFLGANDAVLEHGPDKAQFVSLQDYRENLRQILHTVRPLLAPGGQVLLITPPCVIDAARQGDRSNASAGKYARVCVELAAAENVHVLDLHTYFNTTFPDESERRQYFVDGLHFSDKGNKEVAKLLGVAINGMFDKDELAKFNKWQLPDWHDLVPHDAE
ncbi:unnamed protein product [Phytophthora lilii]|uniref:Unnamed protein product n=1 Tax=Phytophthora lilii TaxID=2077276 RepID=A0A9W6TVS2_9STRA|nr:unnamed protein product [Phytophthora lilii]